MIQELIADGCHGVMRYQLDFDKIMRLHAQTAIIDERLVRIPESASWLGEYLHEMAVFPNSKYDDRSTQPPSSLTGSRSRSPYQGLYEYYRQEVAKLEAQRRPQPVQTTWAIGSMEWLTEQNKSK